MNTFFRGVTWTLVVFLALVVSGCSVTSFVKDVTQNPDGSITVERCQLTVYLAFYGLIAKPTACEITTPQARVSVKDRSAGAWSGQDYSEVIERNYLEQATERRDRESKQR